MKVKWQSDAPKMELVIPKGQYLPYELPVATKEVLGGVKVDGDTINITSDGVISTQKVDLSGVATKVELEEVENKIPDTTGLATKSEVSSVEAKIPSEYLKNASVADNKLTITKSSGDTIEFSGGGGGGEAQLDYNISSTATFTEQDKEVIKSAIKFGTGFFIDGFNVIRIMSIGSRRVFIILKVNGATDNHIVGYQVDIDADKNVTSSVFTTFIDYVLVGSNSAISGDIITSDNWESYIILNADNWIKTTKDDSNLYNAKQLWVIGTNQTDNEYYEGIFRFDYSDATTVLGDCSSDIFHMDGVAFFYNGFSLTESLGTIQAVYYKT